MDIYSGELNLIVNVRGDDVKGGGARGKMQWGPIAAGQTGEGVGAAMERHLRTIVTAAQRRPVQQRHPLMRINQYN